MDRGGALHGGQDAVAKARQLLSRSGEGASMLTAGYEKSYVNRAAALYRALAGIKTDQEPPAAP